MLNRVFFILLAIGISFGLSAYNFMVNLKVAPVISLEVLEEEKAELTKIVNKFIDVVGIFNANNEKPTIHFASQDTNNQLATYNHPNRLITFYPQLIHYANQLNSTDKNNLYHFLIGHELGHFFVEMNESFFISDELNWTEGRFRKEIEADFFSVFINLLVGRKEIKSALPLMLTQLYRSFSLQDTQDPEYPPLELRKKADSLAILRADSLNNYFQLATQLSAINHPRIDAQFEPAIEMYDYLLHFFNAAEFYNNRGILYYHQAIQENYGDQNEFERFFYPLELDVISKLVSVKSNKKTTALKDHFFKKALADFELAAKFGNNQERYLLNQANIQAILGNDTDALNILKDVCLSNGDTEQLLIALILLNRTNTDTTAIKILEDLAAQGEERIHLLAKLNLAILKDDKKILPQFEKEMALPELRAAEYAESIELENIKVTSLTGTSLYSYGWETSSDGGKCFIVKKNDSLSFATFVLPPAGNLRKISTYPHTKLGHNFESYLFADEYTLNGIIYLEDQAIVVKNYSLH